MCVVVALKGAAFCEQRALVNLFGCSRSGALHSQTRRVRAVEIGGSHSKNIARFASDKNFFASTNIYRQKAPSGVCKAGLCCCVDCMRGCRALLLCRLQGGAAVLL